MNSGLQPNDSAQESGSRFGIVCDSTELKEWEARCLEHLLSLDYAQPALVMIREDCGRSGAAGIDAKRSSKRFPTRSIERLLIRCKAFQPRLLNDLCADVTIILCRASGKATDKLLPADSDLQTIRSLDLDFILDFCAGDVGRDLCNVAKYGVWSFCHGAAKAGFTAPPFYYEMRNDENVVYAALQRLTASDNRATILRQGWFGIVKESYCTTVDDVFFESSKWPALVLQYLRNTDSAALNAPVVEVCPQGTKSPTMIDALVIGTRMFKNFIKGKYMSLFWQEHWNIGLVSDPIHRFLDRRYSPEIRYLPGQDNRNIFRADPFGIATDDGVTILFELFDYRVGTGVIAGIEMSDPERPTRPQVICEQPFHISYPYLFQHRGHIYCVPETGQARRITLYKAGEFPSEWTKVADLVTDMAGVDSTLFRHNGTWWLFCSDADADPNLNLFIWYSPRLTGPWRSHLGNPVKTDVRSARPAGTPFEHDGRLYRPSQDCSGSYGGRVAINRIVTLTPTEFREEKVAILEPNAKGPFPHGIHTLSAVGNGTLVDGMRYRFVGIVFRERLLGRFRKTMRFLANLFAQGTPS